MHNELRRNALAALVEYLESQSRTARVRLRRDGYQEWFRTWPWPEPGIERAVLLRQIKASLEGMERAGEVGVLPAGFMPDREALFSWPEAPGLFPADPPPDKRPVAGPHSEKGEQTDDDIRVVRKPPKASRVCAGHVLMALFHEQKRLTGSQLVNAFAGQQEWSVSTVEATCSWLIAAGQLSNGRDAHGKGYGLIRWDREPALEVDEEPDDE